MSVREEPRLAASASTAALCGDLGTSPAAARSIAVPARNLVILAELGWKPGRPTLEEMIEDARAFHARRC